MSTYRAPLREMQFVRCELAGINDVAKLPGFEDTPEVLDAPKDPFYAAKLATARFSADHVLNQAQALHHEIVRGSASVMTLTEDQFDLDRQVLVVA
jgi:hypothetical protein